VYHGLDRILWIPPAYRDRPVAVRDGTLVLVDQNSVVLFFEFDFAKMPLSSRDKEKRNCSGLPIFPGESAAVGLVWDVYHEYGSKET